MKRFNFLKRGVTGLVVLVILVIAGTELFQGQRNYTPLKETMFNYDENDPYIDRPTREAYSHVIEGDESDLDIITDGQGFDNFEIGVDFAEQMLVSNPRNPLQMHFGVNASVDQNAYYTANGYDWVQSNPVYHSLTCCDPWSAWDSLGNLFYGSGVQGQYIYKSTNGGQTYGPAILSVNGNDRNTLAADQTNGPFKNYLYAAITPGNFARSTDNGATWTQTYTSSNTIPGTMITVGPNGATQGGCVIYVTNTGSTQNVTYTFHRSTNGGASGSFVVASSLTVAGYVGTLNSVQRLVINNGRTRPYPMIAMDNSYGPNRGKLYLVYASNVPAGNGFRPNIIMQHSTNMGTTWSSKITVNSDTTGHQWFPAIWCEKETGRLYIKWYDTKENPATYAVNVYATYTDDGGATFAANQKLTTQSWIYPNPSCAPNTNCYRGDYDGMTANTKAGFAVWYDGRLGTYKNVGSYFPDFGMLATPPSNTVHQTNSSVNYLIDIPAVKLYSDTTTFSASVSPAPGTGSIQFEFLGGNKLTSYPNTKFMKVKTVGTVTTGAYTITITGQGSNGTPVHKRTVGLTVNTTVGPTICEDFTGVKFPPASMFDEFTGTEYWSRATVSAYGVGTGSAKFDFYTASVGTVQSLTSNNFPNTAAGSYLTFDQAYAPYISLGPDTLVVQSSTNFGGIYTTLATLQGKVDGTGELNTAPPNVNPFTPIASEWRPKIYTLPVGTNKIRLMAKSGFGNNLYVDNVCVQVLSTPVAGSIGVVPEGIYIPAFPFIVFHDSVNVYLHRTDFPNIAVDSVVKAAIQDNANVPYTMTRALSGTYYVKVRHRNSIETWSKLGGAAYSRGGFFFFNFVQPSGQAFLNNQKLVNAGNGDRGMFSGDCNQDYVIDAADLVLINNDMIVFASGYIVTDLNGDFFADAADLVIAYNNAINFVQREAPPGAAPSPEPLPDLDKNTTSFESEDARLKYEAGKKFMEEMKNKKTDVDYVRNSESYKTLETFIKENSKKVKKQEVVNSKSSGTVGMPGY